MYCYRVSKSSHVRTYSLYRIIVAMRSLEILTQIIFNNLIKQNQFWFYYERVNNRVQYPEPGVQSAAFSIQSPAFRVQRSGRMSRAQRRASCVQIPGSSVQYPTSRVQRIKLVSRVQESRYSAFFNVLFK